MININDYLTYIKQNERRPIYKVELLRKSDETPYQTIEGKIENNSGALTISNNEGVRRTVNFNLINFDQFFTPVINTLSLGSKFKLYLGYEINGENFYLPQGVFIFDDPTLVSNLSQKLVQISGSDKFSMLNGQNGGILEGTYKIPVGTKVSKLVRDILVLNVVNDPIEPLIDPSIENLTIPYEITKRAGEVVSDIIFEATFSISAHVYYNSEGRLVVEPEIPDNQKGSIYDFNTDEYNYLSSSKKYLYSEVYNSTLVQGDNIQNIDIPITYEAINNDLSDPNSVPNLGYKKVKPIDEYTKGINTKELAEIRAKWELKKVSALLSSVDITALPLYHLDVNQAITLTDKYVESNKERFIIQDINLPIGTSGEASLTVSMAMDDYD